MTVICWDGKTLAADKRSVNNGLIRKVTKIRRIGNLLCGASGEMWACQEAFEWIERGRKPEDYPKCQTDKDYYADLLVIDNGKILKYERSPYPLTIEDETFAMGSGRDFAISSMFYGGTAQEAVQFASLFDPGCGSGMDFLKVEA
jgi:ATP-dependent protease HslVU (ClpYQ) peptidase subunit